MLCHHKIGSTFVAALVLFCLGVEVRAETISIVASDNAWVNRDKPGVDHSEGEQLEVKSDGSEVKTIFTYLRFDLSPLVSATVTSASLDMYSLFAYSNTTVYVVALNDLADGGMGTTETSWDSHITWNNQPQGTGTLPNATYTSDLLASVPILKAGLPKFVRFDLTSDLPGLLDSDTNRQLTLIVYGGINQWNNFASLANTDVNKRPTLNVEYSNPIPEPGTLALLGVALLGLGWYAWGKRGVRG